MAELERELAEWRAGKRRIFWRCYSRYNANPEDLCAAGSRKVKRQRATEGALPDSVVRVTVVPAKPKEAK